MRRSALYNWQHAKQVGASLKAKIGKLLLVTVVLLICTVSLLFTSTTNTGADRSGYRSECLVELLQGKEVNIRTNAVLLMTELICLKRKKDVSLFFTGLQNEGMVNAMAILLEHLQNSLPNQRPLAAVLLFFLDILVCRIFLILLILVFSIYSDSMPLYFTLSLHHQCHL